VDVHSKVSERVLEVLVEEGGEVDRGEVLARLDAQAAQVSLDGMEIEVKVAQQKVAERKLALQEGEEKVLQAERDEAKARRDHERNVEIAKEHLVSAKDLEDSQSVLDRATNALSLARFLVQKTQVEHLSAVNSVAKAESQAESMRIELMEREVRSPIDGIVAVRHVRGGEMVSSGFGPLFRVVDHRNLVCHVNRPQRELAHLAVGQAVRLTADAFPDTTFHGEVDLISPVVERDTGSFRVRIAIRDPERKLRPGMFLRVSIVTGESKQALMLGKRAIIYEGERPIAFVVRENRAQRVFIERGIDEREHLEVLNRGDRGFLDGDVVVVSGHKDLADGAQVETVRE
jgi:RND family efflux transporter MFP subunit